MQTHFEKQFSDLQQSLLTMASHAETAVRHATQSVLDRDVGLARKVRENDDVLDHYEIEIDESAIQLLSKAPLATDLRLITVVMKLCLNLERVGDEATKIAKRAQELSREAPLPETAEIPGLAELAIQILRRALDAFVRHDGPAARALIPQDKDIDEAHRRIHRALADRMVQDAAAIPRALHLMVVAKSLERIADHAKNIAEEVVYLCEAEDIRHRTKAASNEPAAPEGD